MLDLDASERNGITINHPASGSKVRLFYRTPTTEERIGYQAEMVQRKGSKVLDRSAQTRIKYAMSILTGFREGDFGSQGKPISSEPDSPNYLPDWKERIAKTAADVLLVFAHTIFEAASAEGAHKLAALDLEEAAREGEDAIPFQRS